MHACHFLCDSIFAWPHKWRFVLPCIRIYVAVLQAHNTRISVYTHITMLCEHACTHACACCNTPLFTTGPSLFSMKHLVRDACAQCITYDSEFRLPTAYVMVHACMLQPCGLVHVCICVYVRSLQACRVFCQYPQTSFP